MRCGVPVEAEIQPSPGPLSLSLSFSHSLPPLLSLSLHLSLALSLSLYLSLPTSPCLHEIVPTLPNDMTLTCRVPAAYPARRKVDVCQQSNEMLSMQPPIERRQSSGTKPSPVAHPRAEVICSNDIACHGTERAPDSSSLTADR
jgi:hypothetical protein